MKSIQVKTLAIATILALAIIQLYFDSAQCAPNANNLQSGNSNTNSNNNKNNNNKNLAQNRPINYLRGLFRRQTSSSASSSTSTDSGRQQSNVEAEGDEAMSQTELDAQKFMDTLPNVNNNNDDRDRPNSFRERVSGTFGVLREGVSNQFKTMRENWSDTIEDLRDTWSNNSD